MYAMKTFKIEIKETLSRIVEIEADDVEEALLKIQDQYKNEDIILDAADFVETAFISIKL
jgi:flagellar biosynthesis regulator FlbT